MSDTARTHAEPTPDTGPMAAEVLRLRAENAHLHRALAALLGPSAGLRGTLPPCPHSYRLADDDAPADLREALATYAHEAWAGWMRYLFSKSFPTADGSVAIPAALVARWERQSATAYADLPGTEQESDRAEADQMLAIMAQPGPGPGKEG